MRSTIFAISVIIVAIVTAGCSPNDDPVNQNSVGTSTEQTVSTPDSRTSENEPISDSAPTTPLQQDTSGDLVIAESLEDLVASSEAIIVTKGARPAETVNMARNMDDPEEPDTHVFVLGQVYDIEVNEYLKGEGDSLLNVVQREGFLHGRDEPVAQTYFDDEINAIKQDSLSNEEHLPLNEERTYVMFLRDLGGFDAELNYLTGAAGVPWRFEIADDGKLVPESQSDEANEHIGALRMNQVETAIEENAQ